MYRKPEHWTDPANKLFPFQVGFTAPPRDFDAAPTDFLRMAPEGVGVHGRMLHVPGYAHELAQRAASFHLLEEFVECMANNGADVTGQVGTNWVHCNGTTPEEIREFCARLSETYETPFHMAGYCLVEGLRALDVEKIALNSVYYWPDWRDGVARFLRQAGFDLLYSGNFVDLGSLRDPGGGQRTTLDLPRTSGRTVHAAHGRARAGGGGDRRQRNAQLPARGRPAAARRIPGDRARDAGRHAHRLVRHRPLLAHLQDPEPRPDRRAWSAALLARAKVTATRRILALWAVPRSTSTAFEWMMRMRGDMTCFHEPFGEAWYQGEEPLWPRVRADSVRNPGLTLESVWLMLRKAIARGPVFSKDFPHYVAHMWTGERLAMFDHSFLIRDPAKTITSMYEHWPDFHPGEVGFVEQRELFDRVADRDGRAPPVLDSDDLLADPYPMVKAYCEAVGIAFVPTHCAGSPEPAMR